MNINTSNLGLLSRIAHKTLQAECVDVVNTSTIYQISEGWQRDVLIANGHMTIATDTLELEEAVQQPNIYTILIPLKAALTQELTKRILLRNPLPKTILWEVTKAKAI